MRRFKTITSGDDRIFDSSLELFLRFPNLEKGQTAEVKNITYLVCPVTSMDRATYLMHIAHIEYDIQPEDAPF